MQMPGNKTRWVLAGLMFLAVAAAESAGARSWRSYMEAGNEAYQQGNYAEAEKQWEAAVNEAEGFRRQDARLADALNTLGGLYRIQDRYAEAQPLLERALAIVEKVLEPEDSFVADVLNNLAGLYQTQGRYAEAEPLFERALAIREKALGPQHHDVATVLSNLALLYKDQG